MQTLRFNLLALCFASAVALCSLALRAAAAEAPAKEAGEQVTLSGPYTHDNLTVFLIHGKDRIDMSKYLTLQEAIEQKKVIVNETGSVNELTIENVSDMPVYVQSTDIVKGGRQDRTIANDFICPPHSGKAPIASFCVEHGRWVKRGEESAAAFGSSNGSLSSRELKLAAKQANSQQEVWKEVHTAQMRLNANVGASVESVESPSSYQLTLDNAQLQATTEAYIKELSGIIEHKEDVIGYAFAINGKMNSADVYAASQLFRKMWPKLIRSAAVEAIADYQKDKKLDLVSVDAVKAFLADAESGAQTQKGAGDKINLVTQDGKAAVLFETRDKDNEGRWVHRNYIAK